MKRILNTTKKVIYCIGILSLFSMNIVLFDDLVQGKKDLYMFVIIGCSIYSLIIMIVKIVKSIDLLEQIQNIMYSKKTSNEEKYKGIEYLEYDIDAFLNEYKN